MPNYKVVIPCAGVGQRLEQKTQFINKALITVGNKPAICHVIEKFPATCEFVIILGYKGDQVKEIVQALYPKHAFTFVFVDKYEGKGSGLGYSLLKAKDYLNCPFIFIANDTIVLDEYIARDPGDYGNWLLYYKKNSGDGYKVSSYRTVTLSDDYVFQINAKGILSDNIYIGVCGINNYKTFWSAMISQPNAIDVGEAIGLSQLNHVKAYPCENWFDCGSLETLNRAQKALKKSEYNVLDKLDEAIWFKDGLVTKFSTNTSFISDRISRLKYLPRDVFPNIVHIGKYFYQYDLVNGTVLSECVTDSSFLHFLDTCNLLLWSHTCNVDISTQKLAHDFYKIKTEERVAHYMARFEQVESELIINDVPVKKVEELLQLVDWESVASKIRLSRYHGDLHGENVLVKPDGNFVFIDWRQNFGENGFEFGDTYYDLAKILHGLIVNHGQVNLRNFRISQIGEKNIYIDILRPHSLVCAEVCMERWCLSKGFDFDHIKFITSLIYLNICGLHDWPYAQFLYMLGRKMLHECLISNYHPADG
ncbi:phosphotransferase [Rhodobacterales bacterium FZCC0188]|nr:phosphotransferase [Rhodobacterales bacterium FZCC0188]